MIVYLTFEMNLKITINVIFMFSVLSLTLERSLEESECVAEYVAEYFTTSRVVSVAGHCAVLSRAAKSESRPASESVGVDCFPMESELELESVKFDRLRLQS